LRYALFDLDHTLLPFDTQALFCNFVLKRHPWRRLGLLWFLPFGLAKALRLVSTARAKQAFHAYLCGMPTDRLQALVREFVPQEVMPRLYPEVLERLEQHRREGALLVLNTASPSLYAREIADALRMDACVATEVSPSARLPLWMPLPLGNNKGQAKIPAMLRLLPQLAGQQGSAEVWAYSDSAADLPLLNFAGNAVLVHPSASLRAVMPGAEVLLPPRPYRGRVGDMLAVLQQVLGLYPQRPQPGR
jgi:phosphoserine phosphatase